MRNNHGTSSKMIKYNPFPLIFIPSEALVSKGIYAFPKWKWGVGFLGKGLLAAAQHWWYDKCKSERYFHCERNPGRIVLESDEKTPVTGWWLKPIAEICPSITVPRYGSIFANQPNKLIYLEWSTSWHTSLTYFLAYLPTYSDDFSSMLSDTHTGVLSDISSSILRSGRAHCDRDFAVKDLKTRTPIFTTKT